MSAWPTESVGLDVSAPAKLNLWLQVGMRRRDGYHSIRSLMVGLTLEDHLQVCYKPAVGRSVLRCPDRPELETQDNLCLQSVRWWMQRFGPAPGHLELDLRKQVPIAAGLGGGSSDAAAVLRALRHITGTHVGDLPHEELVEIGSDVPFCLQGEPAVVEGRGERVTPRPIRPFPLCLVRPAGAWSSAEAYQALDALDRKVDDFGPEPDIGHNDFWELALQRRPELASIRAALDKTGALATGMSGKGPVMFALYETMDQAGRAAQRFARSGLWAKPAQMIPGIEPTAPGFDQGPTP